MRGAEVWDRKIILDINANVPDLGTNADSFRAGTPVWLPGEDSNLEPSG